MQDWRAFGNIGFDIVLISLGTVALGVNYGIETMRGKSISLEDEATNLIRYAVENGVNFLYTAPDYTLS